MPRYPHHGYDNTLAETVNGYCEAAQVRGPVKSGRSERFDDLELVTAG